MNLYIFNESRRGSVYGVGTYIRELSAALKGSDTNVCVVNIASDKPQIQFDEIEGIRNWHIPAPIEEQRTIEDQKIRELYYCNVVYLLQLHIEDKTNLVFHLNYNQCGSLAEELKNVFDCRIVAVVHFTDWSFKIYDNLQRLRDILNEERQDSFEVNLKKSFEKDKSYYLKVDRIICLSNYMQEILCRDYGIDVTKISIIANGLPDLIDAVADKKFLRKKWNIPTGEKIILFAGRVDEVKGVSFLIKAFREVLSRYVDCRLIIAGSGDYDVFFREAKDICTKVTFTGLLEKNELHEIYQIADVGVVPSLFEMFGYVPVEMMMYGLPIVATATSGLNEVVDDTCGFKIPIIEYPDRIEVDTDLLAEKIIYLLQNPAEARAIGQNGRKRYLQEYTVEVFRTNMVQFYKSLFAE